MLRTQMFASFEHFGMYRLFLFACYLSCYAQDWGSCLYLHVQTCTCTYMYIGTLSSSTLITLHAHEGCSKQAKYSIGCKYRSSNLASRKKSVHTCRVKLSHRMSQWWYMFTLNRVNIYHHCNLNLTKQTTNDLGRKQNILFASQIIWCFDTCVSNTSVWETPAHIYFA